MKLKVKAELESAHDESLALSDSVVSITQRPTGEKWHLS